MVAVVQSANLHVPNSATTATVTFPPSAPVSGRLLVAAIGIDKQAGTVTCGSGWTLASSYNGLSVSQGVAYRIADGTATDQSCTFTWTTARGAKAAIFETDLTGASLSQASQYPDPANDVATNTSLTGDAGAATATGWAVAFGSIDSHVLADGVPTWGGSYTAIGTFHGDTSGVAGQTNGGACLYVAAKDLASGTATSTTFTYTPADQSTLAVLRFTSAAVSPPTLLQRFVGIPSSTTGRVAVRTSNATSVRLKVGTDAAVTQNVVFGPEITPDATMGTAQLTVTGLTAGTRYYYRVEMTDAASATSLDTGTVGEFRTAPTGQASFAFCFASCAGDTDGTAAAAAAARRDDMFLMLGDFYYQDGTGTGIANFRTQFDARIQNTGYSTLFATAGCGYTPSDHDGMTNGSTAGADATAWTNWNTAYRERIAAPSLPGGTTGVYHTWTWGRLRFIQIDTRSFKTIPSATDNATKTALGATQKQWLKDTITAAGEPVIIIVQDGPWIAAAIAGDDGWAGYTTERTELANFFAASGKNIAMLAGDMHALAADSGTNSPGGVPVFHASPMNRAASQKGGPYTVGPYPASGTAVVQQYGRMVVTDAGSSISLAYTGYSADNTQRVTLTKTYTVPANYTAAPADTAAATDAVAAAREIAAADVVAGTDAVTGEQGFSRAAADTAIAADAATIGAGRAPADIASGSDAVGTAQAMSVSVADTAAATDGVTVDRAGAGVVGLADTAAATDAVATVGTASRTAADTGTATDAAISDLSRAVAAVDAGAAADVVSLEQSRTVTAADAATGADAATVEQARALTVADTGTAADAATAVGGGAASPADTAAAADAVTAVQAAVRTPADTATATDAVSTTAAAARVLADAAAAVDAAAAILGFGLAATTADAAAAGDAVSAVTVNGRDITVDWGRPTTRTLRRIG